MFPLRIHAKAAMPLGSRPLRVGCRGRDVLALQRELVALGYLAGADGRYGFVTEAAVQRLQAQRRLVQDGVAGPDTIAGLRAAREGWGLLTHRVRAGEPEDEVAASLGITLDALRRQNRLRRRDKIVPGMLISVRTRVLLSGPDEEPPPGLKCTAILGPRVVFSLSGVESEPAPPSSTLNRLPILMAAQENWSMLLRRPRQWADLAAELGRFCREHGWARWAVDLPPSLWWRRRRLLKFLRVMAGRIGQAAVPIIRWPGQAEPLPDLAGLAKLGGYVLLDPGPLAFDARELARLMRQVAGIVPLARLVLLIRAGGLFCQREGTCRIAPVREARATALAARTRLNWDETERVYHAVQRGERQSWELRLLEERALRERVRLADRLDCAGIALSGLAGMSVPQSGFWPGEFAVLDSFPSPRHID